MIPLLNRGGLMKGFVQGADRQQTTLLPECLDDWVGESNPIRAVDVFVDALELRDLGFDGVDPAATGRPAYHCVYRKSKSERIDDEVRPVWRANL
jgi:transposase